MSLRRFAQRALAVSALALALAVPAPAAADHGPALLDDRLGTYLALAQWHWAGAPVPHCLADGTTVIPVHAVLFDDPDPDVAARADQPGCRLWLDRRHWRTMAPVEACTIIVHEWGHLLGHGHSDDPFHLMAELPQRPPPACRTLARAGRKARASARRRARACVRQRKRASRRARVVRTHIRAKRRINGARRARFACLRRR